MAYDTQLSDNNEYYDPKTDNQTITNEMNQNYSQTRCHMIQNR